MRVDGREKQIRRFEFTFRHDRLANVFGQIAAKTETDQIGRDQHQRLPSRSKTMALADSGS